MRGNSRTAHINVRMTDGERAAIVARSSSFGMPPSTFMREAALNIGEKPVKVADEATLRQMLTETKRQGNNLNQAVRSVNKYGVDGQTVHQLSEAVSLIARTASQLSDLLSKTKEQP